MIDRTIIEQAILRGIAKARQHDPDAIPEGAERVALATLKIEPPETERK